MLAFIKISKAYQKVAKLKATAVMTEYIVKEERKVASLFVLKA